MKNSPLQPQNQRRYANRGKPKNNKEELYQSSRTNIDEHIQHIYEEGELEKDSTCRKFRQVQMESNRSVGRDVLFYTDKTASVTNQKCTSKVISPVVSPRICTLNKSPN